MWPETECAVAVEPADLAGGLGSVLIVARDTAAAVLHCAGVLDGNPGSVVIAVRVEPRRSIARDGAGHPAAPASNPHDHAADKEEDLLALFLLDASPVWLPIDDTARLRDGLGEQLGRHCPDSVVFPMGAGDATDRLLAESCFGLCADARERRWITYADGSDAAVAARVEALRARGFGLEALESPRADARKAHALACFTSASHDATRASARGCERYWQVSRIG
jgi:hypothetical protein